MEILVNYNQQDILLSLIRMGIGNQKNCFPQIADWSAIQSLAMQQGLYAVVLDGIEKMPESKRPPQIILLDWIGEVLQNYEYRYQHYCNTISEIAGFYNSHYINMMVLKGYACSLNWPTPEHRPCGDIDIWLFGDQKKADSLLAKEKKIKIDKSHHHHTVFQWHEFIVENHYDFVNVYAHRSSSELEAVFKEAGRDKTCFVKVNGEKVYLPSYNLHALFLIKHMVSHFASEFITLRHILDWAFFAKRYSDKINWEWLQRILDDYHMKDFFNCINAICIEELGFESSIFPEVIFLPSLKDKIFIDVMNPQFTCEEPRGFFKRLLYKYKRWEKNAWKQKLCYKESRFETFLYGIWAHIIKPSSL